MRIIPNMTVVVPADSHEGSEATKQAASLPGPVYLRLGRAKVPFLDSREPFQIGKASILTDGADITIVASGHLVTKALDAAYELKNKNIQARVINLHTPKPIDREAIIKAAQETGAVLTVEEHSVFGGVGSAVAEVLVEECPVPMKMMGIRDVFGRSGSPDELFEYFGLTTENIIKETEILLKRKK